mmetsp:Transcript_27939/g.89609  ORF Transcript_27939/g.89609 Transcript_27939/m.89609 type:complete len:213 (+) Transcript_27939:563-1201(+)
MGLRGRRRFARCYWVPVAPPWACGATAGAVHPAPPRLWQARGAAAAQRPLAHRRGRLPRAAARGLVAAGRQRTRFAGGSAALRGARAPAAVRPPRCRAFRKHRRGRARHEPSGGGRGGARGAALRRRCRLCPGVARLGPEGGVGARGAPLRPPLNRAAARGRGGVAGCIQGTTRRRPTRGHRCDRDAAALCAARPRGGAERGGLAARFARRG